MIAVNFRVVVVGDVFVDIAVDLSHFALHNPPDLDGRFEAKMQRSLGGAGPDFAIFATKTGFSVSLIGKIGSSARKPTEPDLAGSFVVDALEKAGIEPLLTIDSNSNTGEVIIIYLPRDKRMMVADRGASANLTREDLSPDALEKVKQADILHIDGYNILTSPQKDTAEYLMQLAAEHNTLVAFDVLPHRLYRTISLEELKAYTRFASVVSIELNTARGFLGKPPLEKTPHKDIVIETFQQILEIYEVVFMRISKQECMVMNRMGQTKHIATGFREDMGLLKRGFFKREFAKFLYKYLSEDRAL